MKKTAFWPVAFDLDISPNGVSIIVGPETAKACECAVRKIENLPDDTDYVILPAAGIPHDPIWEYKIMAEIMKDHLTHNLKISYDKVECLCGKTFDTQGEAKAVVEYLRQNEDIEDFVICVKWWHAIRAYNWILLYLKKAKLSNLMTILKCSRNILKGIKVYIPFTNKNSLKVLCLEQKP